MKLTVIAMALAFCAVVPAVAQTAAPAALPACTGETQIIRVSKLKPGATVADFEKAVAQHMAWYRSHGYMKNTQRVGRVATSTGISPDMLVTVHVNAPGVPRDKQDAGWAAYVAAYRAVSDIASEQRVCFPKN